MTQHIYGSRETIRGRLVRDAKNPNIRNITCAIQLGDITQHNAPAEWRVAKRCCKMLDGRVVLTDLGGEADASSASRLCL